MASRLEGVGALARRLDALGKLDNGRALVASVREGIRPAVLAARAAAPVGTVAHYTYKGRLVAPGFTQRSVRAVVFVSKDKQAAFADLGVGAEAFYSLQFIELGTSKFPARPWLVPAFERTRDKQEDGIARGLEKAIDKDARK